VDIKILVREPILSRLVVSLAAVALLWSCRAPDGSLRADALAAVTPLAAHVDTCLARSSGVWDASFKACSCPPPAVSIDGGTLPFRGGLLHCYVGRGFVAFHGVRLPFQNPTDGDRFGLAYAPRGKPPTAIGDREYWLTGAATLDPSRPVLGSRWYRVGICALCD
jgi:hypothetical protein